MKTTVGKIGDSIIIEIQNLPKGFFICLYVFQKY